MDLRELLNNSAIAKGINSSSIGQAFERSDLAISIEAHLRLYPETFEKDTFTGTLLLINSPLLFSLCISVGYLGLKVNKLFRREHYDKVMPDIRKSLQYTCC